MELAKFILHKYRDHIWFKTLKTYKTRWMEIAVSFDDYWQKCRKKYGYEPSLEFKKSVDEYNTVGFTTIYNEETGALGSSIFSKIKAEEKIDPDFWTKGNAPKDTAIYKKFPEIEKLFKGCVGKFIRSAYGSEFSIFYGKLVKMVYRGDGPNGSEVWHTDGGPGTSMILMFYLSETSKANGAMELLNWDITLKLLKKDQAYRRRLIKKQKKEKNVEERSEYLPDLAEMYRQDIDAKYLDHVTQPTGKSGLVVAFRNNVFHKGGYVLEPGQTRYAIIFHLYPSLEPTNYKRYQELDIAKGKGYPLSPYEIF